MIGIETGTFSDKLYGFFSQHSELTLCDNWVCFFSEWLAFLLWFEWETKSKNPNPIRDSGGSDS